MQVQFAAKKIDGVYEAALIVDGKFRRSTTSRSAADLMAKLLGPLLSQEQQDGAEIAVNVAVLTAAEVERQEARERRQRETAEAEAEAAAIERERQALDREASARKAK